MAIIDDKDKMAALISFSFVVFFLLIVILSKRSKRKARLEAERRAAAQQKAVEEARVKAVPNNPVIDNASEFVSVFCKCCGAHNRIKAGRVGECEYCGVSLSATRDDKVN
jgi:hypothetical protein